MSAESFNPKSEGGLQKQPQEESFEDYQKRMAVRDSEKVDSPQDGEKVDRVGEIITLAKEIIEANEVLPFPGLNPEDYVKMKATDEEYPGYTTSTDEIIRRLTNEGMKIVFGKHPESGNVYVLPAGSDNIEMDSISPRQLLAGSIEDQRLIALISKIKENSER